MVEAEILDPVASEGFAGSVKSRAGKSLNTYKHYNIDRGKMSEMRKVQKSGHSLVVSIPDKWCKELEIEKGQYLKVDKKKNKIILEAQKDNDE